MLKYLFCLMLLAPNNKPKINSKPKVITYYIVRHAEKDTGSGDVPLSAEGKERAMALKQLLLNKKITGIYSTNYKRTTSTVAPLAKALQLPIQNYAIGDTAFINTLKGFDKGAVLIAGHSNTVDDMANALAGRTVVAGDLPDNAFGDLFIVTKTDGRTTFQKKHFGK